MATAAHFSSVMPSPDEALRVSLRVIDLPGDRPERSLPVAPISNSTYEMVRSILRRRPDLTSAQLERTRELMCDAVPDCVTTTYEALIDGIELPDPDDRHVLAAAIRSGSQVIVTENTADFPADVLDRYDIEAQTPDAFVLHLIDLSPTTVFSVIDAQAAALRDPPFTVDQLLDRLASSELPRSVAALRSL